MDSSSFLGLFKKGMAFDLSIAFSATEVGLLAPEVNADTAERRLRERTAEIMVERYWTEFLQISYLEVHEVSFTSRSTYVSISPENKSRQYCKSSVGLFFFVL